jgi:hypothetical protein
MITGRRRWKVVAATMASLTHLLFWISVWGLTKAPTYVLTTRGGITVASTHYWIVVLTLLFPFAVWKSWRTRSLIGIVLLYVFVWLFRIGMHSKAIYSPDGFIPVNAADMLGFIGLYQNVLSYYVYHNGKL